MPKYYDDWKNQTHHCGKCGWVGLGTALRQGDMFNDVYEVDCPACGERVLIIEFPTLVESRENWDKVSDADRLVVQLAEAENEKREQVEAGTITQSSSEFSVVFTKSIWDGPTPREARWLALFRREDVTCSPPVVPA